MITTELLEKIDKEVDELLAKETPESLSKWLENSKRKRLNYNKRAKMLKLFLEELYLYIGIFFIMIASQIYNNFDVISIEFVIQLFLILIGMIIIQNYYYRKYTNWKKNKK